MTKRLVVVPTFNERDTITTLLGELRRHAPNTDVLVVDDSSPDRTADLVRADSRFGSSVFLVERREKTGIGGAYRDGFAWALARRYDRVAQMDADLSHPPDRLPALLAALDDVDVAVGSRYVKDGRTVNWPARRRLLSRAGNRYVRTVLGLRVAEIPISFTDRTAGSSKMSGSIVREALGRVLVWRVEELLGRRQPAVVST